MDIRYRRKEEQRQKQSRQRRFLEDVEEPYEENDLDEQDVQDGEDISAEEDVPSSRPERLFEIRLAGYEELLRTSRRAAVVLETSRGFEIFPAAVFSKGSRILNILENIREALQRGEIKSAEDLRKVLLEAGRYSSGPRTGLNDYHILLPSGEKILLSEITPSGRPEREDRV